MEGFALLYHSTFLKSISPGGVPPHPFLSPVGMRCLPYCSGAGEPTPEGARMQSLPSGHNRPWFCCPAREHRSPPCGGVAPLPYQGGLQSQANDSAGCCDRDREHRLGAEARRQSLSRRSPTAPFAQGRLLCCPGNNRPRFCCPARERSLAVRTPDHSTLKWGGNFGILEKTRRKWGRGGFFYDRCQLGKILFLGQCLLPQK